MIRKAFVSALVILSASKFALAIEENFCAVVENCVDDKLKVAFIVGGVAVSQVENVAVAQELEVSTFIDVKTTPIQGYSYGLKHDIAVLEILSVTHKGVAAIISDAEFKTTKIAQDKLGFVQAIVITLDDEPPFELPIENDIKLTIAKYKVLAVPAAGADSKLAFSNELKPPGSPATATNLTVAGKSKQPKTVVNAIVKAGAGPVTCGAADYAFFFGTDPAVAAAPVAGDNFKVSMRNKGIALGFSLGIKKTAGNLTFDATLGSPVVELVITKENGTEAAGDGLKGNSATGSTVDYSSATRGAAIAGNTGGDFLGVSAIAGGSVTIGYVADVSGSNKSIPAVAADPAAGGCSALNEILIVSAGKPPEKFSRGDANGDAKINVTDGVIVAQNIFATKLVLFDCKDMLDVNDDGALNTADPVYLLTYSFLKGPAPAAPFKSCGTDATADALACAQANCQ